MRAVLPTYLFAAIVSALGIAAVAYGESDDSPGLQLIGGALAVGAIVLAARRTRKNEK